MPATTTFRFDKSIKTPFAGRTVSAIVTVTVNTMLVPMSYDEIELRSNQSNDGWHVAFRGNNETLNTAPATIIAVSSGFSAIV